MYRSVLLVLLLGAAPLPSFAQLEFVDPSLLKPVLQCVDFQNIAPSQTAQSEFKIGPVKFTVSGGGVGKIIQKKPPPSAHPWVPDPLHFLEISGPSTTWMSIDFKEPVKWVDLNVAQGKVSIFGSNHLCVTFGNSAGQESEAQCHVKGSYIVRTVTMTHKDKIKVGGGEFQPPAKYVDAGDIKNININAFNSEIVIWNVCYWPSIK